MSETTGITAGQAPRAGVIQEAIHGPRGYKSSIVPVSFDEWVDSLTMNRDVPMDQWTKVTAVFRRSPGKDVVSSIETQNHEVRRYAEENLLWIHEILTDAGVTGSRPRENYARAIENLRTGATDGLLIYKVDRLGRLGAEVAGDVARALRERREAGRPARLDAPGDRLFSTSSASDVGGQIVDFSYFLQRFTDKCMDAYMYAQETRSKIIPANRRHRADPKRVAPGAIPFGYKNVPLLRADGSPGGVTRVIDHDEAPIVREIAERVLKGESRYSISVDLNMRAIPTTRSPARRARQVGAEWETLNRGLWSDFTVRRVCAGWAAIGVPTHNLEPLRDAEGNLWRKFEAILDDDTHAALIRKLGDPYRNMKPTRHATGSSSHVAKRTRLLSGLLVCDECEGSFSVNYVTDRKGNKVRSYMSRCQARPLSTVSVNGEKIEDYVVSRWLKHFGSQFVVEVEEESNGSLIEAEIAAAHGRIERYMHEMHDGSSDVMELAAKIQETRDEIAELESRNSAPITRTVRRTEETYEERWARCETISERRSLLESTIDQIIIRRAMQRGRGCYLDGRVDIVWAEHHN